MVDSVTEITWEEEKTCRSPGGLFGGVEGGSGAKALKEDH